MSKSFIKIKSKIYESSTVLSITRTHTYNEEVWVLQMRKLFLGLCFMCIQWFVTNWLANYQVTNCSEWKPLPSRALYITISAWRARFRAWKRGRGKVMDSSRHSDTVWWQVVISTCITHFVNLFNGFQIKDWILTREYPCLHLLLC